LGPQKSFPNSAQRGQEESRILFSRGRTWKASLLIKGKRKPSVTCYLNANRGVYKKFGYNYCRERKIGRKRRTFVDAGSEKLDGFNKKEEKKEREKTKKNSA